MKPKRLLQRIHNSSLNNIAFNDFVALVEALGFELARSRGSHRIYRHPKIAEFLNLQVGKDKAAKPYQIRELLSYIKEYSLTLEEER